MTRRCSLFLAIASVLAAGSVLANDGANSEKEIARYRVGKQVSDFATKDDFASPEAAYATINRHLAAGTGDWKALSSASIRKRLGPGPLRMPKPSAADSRLYHTAEIIETRIYRGTHAHVVARFAEGAHPIDTRSFQLEGGRWLNAGNGRFATLAEAADEFERLARRWHDLAKIQPRQPVQDAAAVLARYVAFLRDSGQPPKEYVLDAIEKHALVAMGEIHHRPSYWRLNCEIVQDPRFAQAAGTIYLELPMHAQPLIDEFLAAARPDTTLVVNTLGDNLWTGWPDQAMLDFFIAVWQTNQKLDERQRIRIVLVDMKRPWSELIHEGNLKKYDCDRDALMADNIRNDRSCSPDQRHALFIVGYAHIENLRMAGAERPIANAGWFLRDQHGADVFSIVQHGPVITNMGKVSGRTCLGLFDEAFAANGNVPIAFSLADSPFGEPRYDLNGDRREASMSSFSDAFDGYVYLGTLEEEIFSPLIPQFYKDEFVQELDQRYRLVFGRGLKEGLGLSACDAASFERWMGGPDGSWGKPRRWRYQLGPVTTWRQGDEGDVYVLWCDPPAPATIDAHPATMEGIIRLVDDFFRRGFRDITARKTIDWSSITTDEKGNSSITYRFEASIWGRETKVMALVFTFAPDGGLISVKKRAESFRSD